MQSEWILTVHIQYVIPLRCKSIIQIEIVIQYHIIEVSVLKIDLWI